jgi:protein tyrosine phosphatase (PTP) superfamily phosphohydrolase (DUF442 family)
MGPLKIKVTRADDPSLSKWIEVPGMWVSDSIAVHPEVQHYDESTQTELGDRFIVCHVPSGMKMAQSPFLEIAIQAARAFSAMAVDWPSITKADVAGLSADVREQIDAIRALARNGDEIPTQAPADDSLAARGEKGVQGD